jgi:uncharacterized protein DUF5318
MYVALECTSPSMYRFDISTPVWRAGGGCQEPGQVARSDHRYPWHVSFRPETWRPGAQAGPGHIDYRLARRAVVEEFRRGRLSRRDVCDAHPELLRAARNLGQPTDQPCPVCAEDDVVLVSYAFGPRLPAHGRCIADANELARLARGAGDVVCYVVEVCPECSWNHLARSFLLGRRHAG